MTTFLGLLVLLHEMLQMITLYVMTCRMEPINL